MKSSRMIVRTGLALVVVGAAALTSACSSSSTSANGKATITFSWWGDSSRAKVTEDAVKIFEQRHPNITVKTQFSPFGAYGQKLATETAGGSAPDLMTIDRGYQNEYAQRGVFLDLASYIPKSLNLSDWDQKFAASGKSDGKQIAVPMAQNSQSLIVDATRVKALGVPMPRSTWTWPDLQHWSEQISQKSGGKYRGFADMGTEWPAFESWLTQRGKTLYDGGKIGFTASDVEQFWNFTSGLRKSNAATSAQVTATIDGIPSDEPLLKHAAAAEWDWDSLFASYVAGTSDKLSLVNLPTVGGQTGMYAKPAMLLAVSSQTKYPAQSVELLNFLVNDPAAAKALGTSRGLFPNLKVRQQLAGHTAGATKAVYQYEQAVHGQLQPTPPAPPKGDDQLGTLMQRTYQQVAFGQLSVTAGANQFMSQAKQTIGQ
jgi:multiple sugar transport system substrate-binding protein